MTYITNRNIPLWVLLLPLLLLPFLAPAILISGGLLGKIGLAVFFTTAALAVNWWLLKKNGLALLGRIVGERINLLFWVVICAYFVIFTAMNLVKYYSMGLYGADTAYFEQSYWNTTHGDFFNMSAGRFGCHTSFIMILLWPFYWLVPRLETLFILRALFITAGAFPLFALAKKYVGAPMSLVFVVVYLFHPMIASQVYNDIYAVHFGMPLLFAAFWAIDNNKLKWFWIFAVAYLIVREDYALTIAVFSFYLWWKKRDWRWAVFPFPVCMIWFYVAIHVVIPAIVGWDFMFGALYTQWGNSFLEVGVSIITRPVEVAEYIFAARTVTFFYYMLLPLGLILLFWRSPEFLLGIPVFFIIALSNNTRTTVILHYYGYPIISFLVIASVYGLNKWGDKIKLKIPREQLFASVAVLLIVLTLWSQIQWIVVPEIIQKRAVRPYYAGDEGDYVDYTDVILEAVAVIPEDASILAPRYVGPFMARRKLISFDGREDWLKDIDYILIDTHSRDARTVLIINDLPDVQKLINSPEFEKVFDKAGVFVYKKLKKT